MNYGIYPSIIAFDLLRPPYWILWGQYGSNLHFDLRNEIPDPKNGIYHVSRYGVAEMCKNHKFTISWGVAIIDDPQNDLNDLEKIHPYDFWLDGPLEVPNQS